MAYAADVTFNLPIPMAFLLTMILSGLLGVSVDQLAFRPMGQRRPLTLAIVSIGLSVILENMVRFIRGNELRSYNLPVLRSMVWRGVPIGKEQLVILFASASHREPRTC